MASTIAGYIGKINPGNGTNYSLGSTAYGVCGTAAGTAAKTVEMTGFKLATGATIFVKFTNANTAASPTLNVQSTGAKPIVLYGTTAAGTTAETSGWQAGAVLCLTYDGTSWVRDQGYNTNTTYTKGSGLSLSGTTFSVATGGITNAMLAGSISNDKLTNSKITIAGNEVSLGGSISLDDLGISHAMHFKGTTTTALSDDATTKPITINNASYTQQEGDVVLYSDAEYVWTGSKWERLGRDSSFKTTQSTVDSGAAATNKWVSRIQQNANGVVTATMGTLDTSGTWSGTAAKATADASGNNIANTYLTKTAGVTDVSWTGNTDKKISKTINGVASDIIQFEAGDNVALTATSNKLTIAAIEKIYPVHVTLTNATKGISDKSHSEILTAVNEQKIPFVYIDYAGSKLVASLLFANQNQASFVYNDQISSGMNYAFLYIVNKEVTLNWRGQYVASDELGSVAYDDIVPIGHGGTGNVNGYIRTGQKSESAIGTSATAEGVNNISSGYASHAEGFSTTALGNVSHAEGWGTIASGRASHVFGEYNVEDVYNIIRHSDEGYGKYVEIVGNGSDDACSNARTLDWDGNEVLAGKLTVGVNPTDNMDVATKQYVDTNYLPLTGGTMTGVIQPNTTETINLGLNDKRWNNIYGDKLILGNYVSNVLSINTQASGTLTEVLIKTNIPWTSQSMHKIHLYGHKYHETFIDMDIWWYNYGSTKFYQPSFFDKNNTNIFTNVKIFLYDYEEENPHIGILLQSNNCMGLFLKVDYIHNQSQTNAGGDWSSNWTYQLNTTTDTTLVPDATEAHVYTATRNYIYMAQQANKDGAGNVITSTYLTKTAGVTGVNWDNTNKKLTKTINNTTSDIVTPYWANLKLNNAASYNTTPEVANIKISNGTATAAGTKGVILQYDDTLKVLNFVFFAEER